MARTIGSSSPSVPSMRATVPSSFSTSASHVAQRRQRATAGAEAVERQLHTEATQRLQRSQVAGLAVVERVLVEVERQLVRVELHLADGGDHPLDERALGQLPGATLTCTLKPRSTSPASSHARVSQAGLADDPVADRHDGAGLFGEVQELCRQQRTALGVVPPQQRLGTGDAAAVGGHDRLVGEAQLAGGERPLELVATAACAARDSARIASVYSSLRERPRRLAWYIAMSALRSSSMAASWLLTPSMWAGMPTATPMLTESSTSTPCTMMRPLSEWRMRSARSSAVCSSMPPSHSTTNSSPPMRATTSEGRVAWRDAVGHLGQQRVADLVADRVVDVLQPVDVHEQDGDVLAGAADAVECVGRRAQQQQAVGQPGERVVVGLAGELALQVLGGGDVAGDATPVLDDAVGGAVQHQVDVERALEAVGAAEADLARPHRRSVWLAMTSRRHLIADGLQQTASGGIADQIELRRRRRTGARAASLV